MYEDVNQHECEHIELAKKADLILIAPASANIIGKIANGICDDLLTTVMSASICPKLIAPSMNTNMWMNPIVQKNVSFLKKLGYHFTGPAEGELACGDEGIGRMKEPSGIVEKVRMLLNEG